MSNTYAIPHTYSNLSLSTGTYRTTYTSTGTYASGGYTLPMDNGVVSIGVDNTKPTSLKVSGDADISGNLLVQGTNIVLVLENIQERLGLLVPNPAIEAEFDQLRELGDQYRKLEALLMEQKRVWEILKKE